MTSQLYMIATPLGNLEDLTLRARRLFEELGVFFAEDSREFKRLLNGLNITLQDKKVFSYASHNMKEATEDALRFLREGKSVGFVSDRGTPGISDPGAHLVRQAHEEGFQVVPVPGASAVPALISASGLLENHFFFQGFLPTTGKGRTELFSLIQDQSIPLCFFESPHRIRDTLQELKGVFKGGKILIGRELTKKFESLQWHELDCILPESLPDLGEYACLLIPGEKNTDSDALWQEEVSLRALPEKEWAKKIALRFGVASSEIYNALQQEKLKKM